MQEFVTAKREEIAELCRKHHLRSLSIFGSAIRDDFDPERSDLGDEELRLMVERQFIHIREVMAQLRREFREVAIRFADAAKDAAKIVDFRNLIIHPYWDVDDEAVWLTRTTKIGPLLSEVEAILQTVA